MLISVENLAETVLFFKTFLPTEIYIFYLVHCRFPNCALSLHWSTGTIRSSYDLAALFEPGINASESSKLITNHYYYFNLRYVNF